MRLELRMVDVVVITRSIRCAKLQSNPHHQQTTTRVFNFLTGWINSVKAMKGKLGSFN